MIRAKQTSWVLILFLMFSIVAAYNPAAAQAASSLKDVNGHWAQAQIIAMLDQGVVAGYPGGNYGPENPITRAEFVSMINRVFQFTQPAPINFTDVKQGDWFYNDIALAVANGYIGGYPDGTIRPNNPITRQEAAVMLNQILKLKPQEVTGLNKFSDGAQVGLWAQNAVAALVEAGILSGNADGTFKPLQATNRAVAAVIMAQVIDWKNKPSVPNQPNGNGSDNGGSINNAAFYIESIDASNVKVTPDGSKFKYKVSMIDTNPIGDVTVTFNEAIQKASKDDINIRAYSGYNANGLLTWLPNGAEDFVKELLFDAFAGGDDDQLAGTIADDYGLAYDSMSLYFEGNPEVKSLQFDFYDQDNNKLTVSVNIQAP